MSAQYEAIGGNLVAVENVPADQTHRYGVLDIDGENDALVGIKGLVEKPTPEDAPSTLAIIGRYILDGSMMQTLSSMVEANATGAGGEIQITDAMARQIGTTPMHGYRFEGTRYDCGTRDGFLEANLAYALADADAALKARLHGLFD